MAVVAEARLAVAAEADMAVAAAAGMAAVRARLMNGCGRCHNTNWVHISLSRKKRKPRLAEVLAEMQQQQRQQQQQPPFPTGYGPYGYAFAPKDGPFEKVARPAPVALVDELAEDVFEVVEDSEC